MKWLMEDRFRFCCSFVLRGLRSRITSRFSTAHQSPETGVSDAFRDRYLRMIKLYLNLHTIIIVEVVNMTNNTQFKTLVNTWLNQKQPMITPSTHASFTLIAENHLIPYFGKRKIGSITETDIQTVSYTHLPLPPILRV